MGRRAAEQRQAAVLDAAEALFIADGIDATSVDAIAKRAGVAKGTVYLYFPSKGHIAKELETRFNHRIVARVRAAAEHQETVAETIAAWSGGLVEAYLDELDVHDMLFIGRTPTRREDVADNLLIDELISLLVTLDIPTADDVAAFVVGGVTLLVDRAILRQRPTDRTSLIAAARRLAGSIAP